MRMLVPPNPTKVTCTFHDLPSFVGFLHFYSLLIFFFFPKKVSANSGKLESLLA